MSVAFPHLSTDDQAPHHREIPSTLVASPHPSTDYRVLHHQEIEDYNPFSKLCEELEAISICGDLARDAFGEISRTPTPQPTTEPSSGDDYEPAKLPTPPPQENPLPYVELDDRQHQIGQHDQTDLKKTPSQSNQMLYSQTPLHGTLYTMHSKLSSLAFIWMKT